MFEVLGYKNTQKLLRIISISDPQISFNRLGCAKKMKEKRSIAVGAMASGYAFALSSH